MIPLTRNIKNKLNGESRIIDSCKYKKVKTLTENIGKKKKLLKEIENISNQVLEDQRDKYNQKRKNIKDLNIPIVLYSKDCIEAIKTLNEIKL